MRERTVRGGAGAPVGGAGRGRRRRESAVGVARAVTVTWTHRSGSRSVGSSGGDDVVVAQRPQLLDVGVLHVAQPPRLVDHGRFEEVAHESGVAEPLVAHLLGERRSHRVEQASVG